VIWHYDRLFFFLFLASTEASGEVTMQGVFIVEVIVSKNQVYTVSESIAYLNLVNWGFLNS